jgi:adenine-specific DNA-methyltransferase
MQPNTLLSLLAEVLSQIPEYTDGENLLKNKIIEDGLKCSPALIQALIGEASLKKHFFVEANVESQEGILVFDSLKFQQFVSAKQFLPDSYTSFSNKIGLTDSQGELLSQNQSVVLNFPYKDCVLEGGQTKDDTKRKEIFWNQTLAPDEIDVLLNPKLITCYKKYKSTKTPEPNLFTEAEEGPTTQDQAKDKPKYFNRSPQGTITDNLIIKGNNLLALHSLKSEFRSKVKLIYIDPPYNTGSDSFGYNDKFNHSTWLVFMKNRLEVARELLRDDGVIAISIDENMQAYLKILLDEIFDKSNYLSTVIVQNNSKGRVLDKNISTSHEYLFLYCKKQLKVEMKLPKSDDEILAQYKEKDERGFYRSLELRNTHQEFGKFNRPSLYYPIYVDKSNGSVSLEKIEGFAEVYPNWENGFEGCWTWGQEKSQKEINLLFGRVVNGNYKIYRKSFANDENGEISTKNLKSIWLEKDYLTDKGRKEVDKLIGIGKFYAPKPLEYIKQIINLVTFNDKDAIVLDYHAGSGTTGHAVLDINKVDGGNRQFILIEQMDYAKEVTCERISKANELYGFCSSFIYLELKKYNQIFIESIQSSKTTKALLEIWRTMQTSGFISYQVDPKSFDANISEFEQLSLENQKKFLLQVLDQNLLYINRSEKDNGDYQVTEEEKEINTEFYNLK